MELETIYSMPVVFGGLYAVGDYHAKSRLLTVTYEVDEQLIRDVLPKPLEPGPEPLVTAGVLQCYGDIHITSDKKTGAGAKEEPYFDVYLSVQCQINGQVGEHILVMFISSFNNHGFAGRESEGMPKPQVRSAELVKIYDEAMGWCVDIEGKRLIEVKAKLEKPFEPENPDMLHWYTLKVIPGTDFKSYDLKKIAYNQGTCTNHSAAYVGTGEVAFEESEFWPVYLFKPLKYRGATYKEFDFLFRGIGNIAEAEIPNRILGKPGWGAK